MQVLGKIPNFSCFCKMVDMLWDSKGKFDIKPALENMFVVQFHSAEIRDQVLDEFGPWHIQNRLLIVTC